MSGAISGGGRRFYLFCALDMAERGNGPLETRQYIRYVQGADSAILFVHGILGTPDHFDFLLPLVPSGWSVHNILLKGHGGGVKDFSAASMAGWKQQVHEALQALLRSHSRVVIAAHSMGTLFAIQEAAAGRIAALFLLNTPLRIHITPQLLSTSWKVFRADIRPDDKWALAAYRGYGIAGDTNIMHYAGWAPRYMELFSEIRKTRGMAHGLTVPAQVYLSLHDEMVSVKSGKLFAGNPHVTVKELRESGHFYYSPRDRRILRRDFCDMLQRVSAQGHR